MSELDALREQIRAGYDVTVCSTANQVKEYETKVDNMTKEQLESEKHLIDLRAGIASAVVEDGLSSQRTGPKWAEIDAQDDKSENDPISIKTEESLTRNTGFSFSFPRKGRQRLTDNRATPIRIREELEFTQQSIQPRISEQKLSRENVTSKWRTIPVEQTSELQVLKPKTLPPKSSNFVPPSVARSVAREKSERHKDGPLYEIDVVNKKAFVRRTTLCRFATRKDVAIFFSKYSIGIVLNHRSLVGVYSPIDEKVFKGSFAGGAFDAWFISVTDEEIPFDRLRTIIVTESAGVRCAVLSRNGLLSPKNVTDEGALVFDLIYEVTKNPSNGKSVATKGAFTGTHQPRM